MYFVSPVSLNFWILSLFLVNGPQALKVNAGYFECNSGINVSPANKNVLTISFIFIIAFKTRYHPIMELYKTWII